MSWERFHAITARKLSSHQWMTTSPRTPSRALPEDRGFLFRTLQVERLDRAEPRAREQALLAEHHHLGGLKAVGEQAHYAASDARGVWVAVSSVRQGKCRRDETVCHGKDTWT